MFSRLLIPLDGSEMAESVLPLAAFVAARCGSLITLIHVIERKPPRRVHGESHLTTVDGAKQYLRRVHLQLRSGLSDLDMHVHETGEGNVAKSLVEHARELDIDLIVMCTHGHRRLNQVLFGTIAQQVIAFGETPVLVVPPEKGRRAAEVGWRSVLVPLDGDPDHEQSVPAALEISRRFGSCVHLLLSVPTYGRLSGGIVSSSRLAPATTSALLEMAEEGAEDYLQRQVEQLQGAGCTASAEVARGDPAAEIVRVAEARGTDLIIAGTHGKIGPDAFWSGSVTPSIFTLSHVPLLLVPASPVEPE